MCIGRNIEGRDNVRILHISRTMGQGGAEKVIFELVKMLVDKGETTMVASCGGIYEQELEKMHVNHYWINDIEKKTPWTIVRTIALLNHIVKTQKIEIIHSHHRMAALYARILKILNPQLGLIYTAHNVFFDKKILTRTVLSRSTIVAVGEGVKKNLINVFGIDSDRIIRIYNGINAKNKNEYFFSQKITNWRQEGNLIIGIIGRLAVQKGVDTFIHAFSLVRQKVSNVRGVIVGEGEEKNHLIDLIRKEKLESYLFMAGYQKEVDAWIRQMDLIVMPSRWEGFPLLPLEVLTEGKAIIASDIEGIREIITNGETGILIPPDNIEKWVSTIMQLVLSEELRKELGRKGKNFINENFSYDNFLKEYYKLYQIIWKKVYK